MTKTISPYELARAMIARPDMLRAAGQAVDRNSVEGDLVVDPMCGSGVLLGVAGRLRRRICGFDISPEMVDYANRLFARHGLPMNVRVGDARKIPIPSASCHLVLTSMPGWNTIAYSSEKNAIESNDLKTYIKNVRAIVREIKRILDERGTCILIQSPEQIRLLRRPTFGIDFPVHFISVPGAK